MQRIKRRAWGEVGQSPALSKVEFCSPSPRWDTMTQSLIKAVCKGHSPERAACDGSGWGFGSGSVGQATSDQDWTRWNPWRQV